ncbi:VWA domain-containing protein [Paraliomyxa miuraensis]|nr:VWA domain-containing protein [Paraliomyxa miuraensis]
MGILGVVGAATCSWWQSAPPEPLDLVSLHSQQSRRTVPADVGTELWAVLRIVVDQGPAEERPPVHVGLVIDTSGSMEGEAIVAARAAAAELVGALQDGDRLTLVTFDSKPVLVVPSVELDDDAREESLERIAAIEARGTTDLAGGLHLALSDLLPHTSEGRVTRLVLLSDGVPNDALAIPSAVAQAASAGITVTALGFGLDYDETLLSSIAQQTGGAFHFLEAPADLVPIFREENLRLQGIAAKDLVLALTTGPNVELREVVGQAFALPQPRLGMVLGDLSRGEERVVVVRLAVGPHRAGATVELLDAALTFRDPSTGLAVDHHAVFLSARAEDDSALLAEDIDPALEREIESAKAAALTLQAVALSRQGNDVDALSMIEQAAPAAAEAAARLDDERLREQAKDMEALAEVFAAEPEGAESPSPSPRAKAAPKQRLLLRQAHGNAAINFQARKH